MTPASIDPAPSGTVLLGVVAGYDAARGIGRVSNDAGEFLFHATSISDGSRSIGSGERVAFLLAPAHAGGLEARSVTKLAAPAPLPIDVVAVDDAEKPLVSERLASEWGEVIVTRGEVIPLNALEFIGARDAGGALVGVLGYRIEENSLEVITLNAFTPGRGVGTALMRRAEEIARSAGVWRLSLTTTDANVSAIAFYLRCGLRIAAVHQNAVEWAREVKQSIPVSEGGLRLRDELEFELLLDHEGQPPRPRAPLRS